MEHTEHPPQRPARTDELSIVGGYKINIPTSVVFLNVEISFLKDKKYSHLLSNKNNNYIGINLTRQVKVIH